MRCLEISHLRNLISAHLKLGGQFNYLVGPNGAGKTSVLEAIHLLARGRSFRGQAAAPIISNGHDGLVVRATLESGHALALSRERAGKTVLHVNQQPVRKLSACAALVPVQLLLPNVSDLVFGPPRERRRFLDWGLFHVKPFYLDLLANFQGANRQRNAILKSWNARDSGRLLEVWTDAFCRHGVLVHELRSSYVGDLVPVVKEALDELRVDFPVELAYRSGWGEGDLEKSLRETLASDVKSTTTKLGPQRADLFLKVPEGAARTTLSRGQGKLLATALILAQARLLQARTQRKSLFLIDELGAEMDRRYLARMLDLLSVDAFQVIATSTQTPSLELAAPSTERDIKLFHVKQGRVSGPSASMQAP